MWFRRALDISVYFIVYTACKYRQATKNARPQWKEVVSGGEEYRGGITSTSRQHFTEINRFSGGIAIAKGGGGKRQRESERERERGRGRERKRKRKREKNSLIMQIRRGVRDVRAHARTLANMRALLCPTILYYSAHANEQRRGLTSNGQTVPRRRTIEHEFQESCWNVYTESWRNW